LPSLRSSEGTLWDPVNQRDTLEVLDATLQLSEGRSVGYERSSLESDPTAPVGLVIGDDPRELQRSIRVRDFAGRGMGRFEYPLKAGEFAIVRMRLERCRNQGTSLADAFASITERIRTA
jgi:hypothetical protein